MFIAAIWFAVERKGGNLEIIKFSFIDLTGALLQDPPWNLSGLCPLELLGFWFLVFGFLVHNSTL